MADRFRPHRADLQHLRCALATAGGDEDFVSWSGVARAGADGGRRFSLPALPVERSSAILCVNGSRRLQQSEGSEQRLRGCRVHDLSLS